MAKKALILLCSDLPFESWAPSSWPNDSKRLSITLSVTLSVDICPSSSIVTAPSPKLLRVTASFSSDRDETRRHSEKSK